MSQQCPLNLKSVKINLTRLCMIFLSIFKTRRRILRRLGAYRIFYIFFTVPSYFRMKILAKMYTILHTMQESVETEVKR